MDTWVRDIIIIPLIWGRRGVVGWRVGGSNYSLGWSFFYVAYHRIKDVRGWYFFYVAYYRMGGVISYMMKDVTVVDIVLASYGLKFHQLRRLYFSKLESAQLLLYLVLWLATNEILQSLITNFIKQQKWRDSYTSTSIKRKIEYVTVTANGRHSNSLTPCIFLYQ